jgi:FkbM family methyltransferase
MQPQADLVYDVGLYDGTDTAYYLSRGYRVVAVEANPQMVASAQERFAESIDAGRLTIVPVGIGPAVGTAQFWICDDHTDWRSFDVAVASRDGARHHSIEVPVVPFRDVLEEHGMPWYCKIDIEGSDRGCLQDLDAERRPEFVSVEFGDGDELELMSALGYDRFKVIDQSRLAPVTSTQLAILGSLPAFASRRLDRVLRHTRATRADGDWRFAYGASGPLHDRTDGAWLTPEQVRGLIARISAAYRSGRIGLTTWFDLHATSARRLGV